MSSIIKPEKMKRLKGHLWILPILLLSSLVKAQVDDGPYHDYDTFRLQKKMIVGIFLHNDRNWELEFTKDGKCHERFFTTGTPCEYTYTITFSTREADVPAGYENVYTLHLKAISKDPSNNATYEMYVNDKILSLDPGVMGYGGIPFNFTRVK